MGGSGLNLGLLGCTAQACGFPTAHTNTLGPLLLFTPCQLCLEMGLSLHLLRLLASSHLPVPRAVATWQMGGEDPILMQLDQILLS